MQPGSAFMRIRTASGRNATSGFGTQPNVSYDEPRSARQAANTVIGGFTRWWVPLEGPKDSKNVLFSLPNSINLQFDGAGAPMCLLLWRRAILLYHPDTETDPGVGQFTVRTVDGFPQFILGEPPAGIAGGADEDDSLVMAFGVAQYL